MQKHYFKKIESLEKLLLGTAVLVLVFSQTHGAIFADTTCSTLSDLDCQAIVNDWTQWVPDPASSSDCSSGVLPATVPAWGSQIFTDAANQYNVPPALVATIYWSVHGGSWQEPPPPYGNGIPYVSSDVGPAWPTSGFVGAVGPFQFQYATWLGYLNSNPTHRIDQSDDQAVAQSAEDLTDAAFGAAQELADLGGTNSAQIGSLSNTLQPDTIVNAMRAYNEGTMVTNPNLPPDPDLAYVTTALETYNSLASSSSCGTSIGNGICLTTIQGDGQNATSWQPLCPWIPQGGYPNIYPGGQCTWWAAYNFDPFPVGSQAGGGSPENLGDGGSWYANAAALGIPTHLASAGPRVGELVSFTWHGSLGVEYPSGHIAYIVGVAANGASFTVSEANVKGLWQVDTGTYPYPDPDINGFIGPDQAAINWMASQPGGS